MKEAPDDPELFRQVIEHIPEVIWMSDPEKDQIFYVSPGYEKIWGRTPESLYKSPRSWLDAIHPEDRDRVLKAALTKQISGEYSEEYRIIRPDGTLRWIHDRAFPIQSTSGKVDRIVGIAQDITERKRAEAILRESEERFSEVVSIAPDAIVIVDETQRILFFNKGAERTFGYEASEVLGKPLDLLLPSRFVEAHRQHIRSFGAGSVAVRIMGERECEIFGRRKDGTEFPALASISRLKRNGKTLFTAIVRDITEQKQVEEKIRQLAYYDPLTGFPNRILFHDFLKMEILQAQAQNKSVAVLLMDLDRFKEINDTLGHHRGDVLLQKVGQRLKEALRPTDIVARLGGDEFGVVLPLASSDDASLVAKKIQKGLEEPFEIEGLPIAIETSIGIALCPDHGENADSLIQRADVALYASKKGGRGYVLYTLEQDPNSPRRLALLGELRRALESGQLFLMYQPKIDLRSGRATGVEALIRWQHPELGLVPPNDFIVLAEQTALIRPLTMFVLREALGQCLSCHQAGHHIHIAVNLSVRNLQDPHLTDQILEVLQVCGMTPQWLELEITESSIMADAEIAMKNITALRDKGVHFSIDDFGIGHSSLSYLKKLPVSSIKIDRSFVKDMLSDDNNIWIVRSTIDLAHNLGLKVIAEGVENKTTLEKLVHFGCDAAQGYYIARPLPANELTRWLSQSFRPNAPRI
jgi:diguanylate cyclase (GGDEF)-like protein/PAS domain S-box-containing protein